jgi:hypothetical protein
MPLRMALLIAIVEEHSFFHSGLRDHQIETQTDSRYVPEYQYPDHRFFTLREHIRQVCHCSVQSRPDHLFGIGKPVAGNVCYGFNDSNQSLK